MIMTSKHIYDKANSIVKKAGTRNPIRIANELGVDIYYNAEFDDLLGMYTSQRKKRAMVVNNRLDEHLLRMVVAHELGHDALHREEAKTGAMQEFVLFQMKDTKEYEANAFAAHLLIDTKEVLEMAYEGMDIASMASNFNVYINLMLIKLNELTSLGYDLRVPMETRGDFLKNITV